MPEKTHGRAGGRCGGLELLLELVRRLVAERRVLPKTHGVDAGVSLSLARSFTKQESSTCVFVNRCSRSTNSFFVYPDSIERLRQDALERIRDIPVRTFSNFTELAISPPERSHGC